MYDVTIAYRTVPHYRAPFYELLRRRLAGEGITLRLLSGAPEGEEAARRDTVGVEWAEPLRRHQVRVPAVGVVEWQGLMRTTQSDRLLIVEDAVRLLSNAAALVRRRLGRGPLVALWGHGADLQSGTDGGPKEAVRRVQQRSCDWYFAYTGTVAERVAAHGVPRDRITNVMNTIDTRSFAAELEAVTAAQVRGFRSSVGASSTGPIGLFCGGLYEHKRIPFLLDAAEEIATHMQDFRLAVIGDGPLAGLVKDRSRHSPIVRYLGPLLGHERASAFRGSDVVLMPGLVGLVVVDAFVAGCPLITTADGLHSPEIDYLQNGVNGYMLPVGTTAHEYAAAVCRLLGDGDQLARLRANARHAAAGLSLESMVTRFTAGIMSCLEGTGPTRPPKWREVGDHDSGPRP